MVYTTMTNFEIMLLNYVRELFISSDVREKWGIVTKKNNGVIVTTEHDFDDANEENRNEGNVHDKDFLNSYWVEFLH